MDSLYRFQFITAKNFTKTYGARAFSLGAKATGYILQYSTDKKFKKAVKTVTIKKNGTTTKTISKLKGGKKYYVRICSISGGKSIKGAYSPVKAVTVKK